jgi:group I intron endonuclease
MVIYKITNKKNNKFYIGQTRNELKNRWRDHVGSARRGSLAPVHQALRKYGIDNFKLEILAKCSSLEELNEKEIEFIAEMKPQYNIQHGGNTTFTEEHSRRVKEAMQKPEIREKMLKSRLDPKVNKKLRRALKDKVHSNKETVSKMIKGGMQFAKKIKAINITTGEEFIFDAQRIAERTLKIPNSSIRKVLRGQLKQTHGFRFVSIREDL